MNTNLTPYAQIRLKKVLVVFWTAALILVNFQLNADPISLDSEAALVQTLSQFNGSVLFIGHGSKGQYADMAGVQQNLDRIVALFNSKLGAGRWAALFGGDNFNAEKPDIAHVMKYLKDKHGIAIVAVQSDVVIKWGGVDKYIDYVRYIPTVEIPALDEKGQPVFENGKQKMKTHWGGFIDGVPRGPTEVYLSQDLIGGQTPILKAVVAVGGGPIGLDEAQYAYAKGVPVIYVRAEARYPEVNGRYGSLDEWANGHHGKATSKVTECGLLLSGKIQVLPEGRQ